MITDARKQLLEDKLVFSHIILYHNNSHELAAVLHEILNARHLTRACIMVVCDPTQKRGMNEQMSNVHFEELAEKRRLAFILKPLKPSKLAPYFDPTKSREMSLDHNQHSAQQTVKDQRDLYARVKEHWADRGVRVLIVEDNMINVNVIRGFFKRVDIPVDIAMNGIECVKKVFKEEPDYYSIILCDLQMPLKDGFQTCREIRAWQLQNKHETRLPMVALSANVLGEVARQCQEAGYDQYLEKPLKNHKLEEVLKDLLGDYYRR